MIARGTLDRAVRRILVVEDDPPIGDSLSCLLTCAGFAVDLATTGRQAIERARDGAYDIALLDLTLPDLSGQAVLATWRGSGIVMPVLVLTGLHERTIRIATLDAGADFFMSKPANPDEIVARVRTLLRSRRQAVARTLGIGRLQLDLGARTAYAGDQPLRLTSKQFALLEVLVRRQGRVATRELLIDQLYGECDRPALSAIDVFVHTLRKHLRGTDSGATIRTLRGEGFSLVCNRLA